MEQMLWVALMMAVGTGTFIGAFVLLRRARTMEDMPTSRIRSAAQGYVEIEGHARLLPGPDILSPLSRQRCAWWSYSVRHYDAKNRRWDLVESETSGELFQVVDSTGSCIVDPHGAQVTPSISRSWRGRTVRPQITPKKTEWISFGDYAYTEKQIRIGDMLYATGQFRTQGVQHEFNEAVDVLDLLKAWKRDQPELLARFDANQDGRVDEKEWDAVRRAAIEKVRADQVEHSLHPDIHVLTRPAERRQPFILSTVPQAQLTRRYRVWAVICLMGSLACGALVFTLLSHAGRY